MLVTPVGMLTLRSPEPEKAPLSMVVSPVGRVMPVRDVQEAKAFLPMEVTPLGMVTLARDSQPANVSFGMLVKPEGRVTLVRLTQRKKTLSPKPVKFPSASLTPSLTVPGMVMRFRA